MYRFKDQYRFEDYNHRRLWVYGDDNGYMHYCIDGLHERTAKLQYKSATGWNCSRYGLWFMAQFPDGGRKRIYLMDLVEYR